MVVDLNYQIILNSCSDLLLCLLQILIRFLKLYFFNFWFFGFWVGVFLVFGLGFFFSFFGLVFGFWFLGFILCVVINFFLNILLCHLGQCWPKCEKKILRQNLIKAHNKPQKKKTALREERREGEPK